MPRSETLLRRPHDRAAVARALRAAAAFIEEHDDREHPIVSVLLSTFEHSTTLEVEVRDHLVEDTGRTVTVRTMAAPIAAAFRGDEQAPADVDWIPRGELGRRALARAAAALRPRRSS